MDSTERNIAIIGIIVVIIGIFYSYSTNLQPFGFDSPPEIKQNHENYFDFKVHNYGDKSGSYKLEVSSEDFLIKMDTSIDTKYEHSYSIKTHIEDEDDQTWRIHIKLNDSNLPPNASVRFSYVDTSPIIFKEKYTWNLFYERDDSQRDPKYHFINQTVNFRKFIVYGNEEIMIGSI